MPLWKLEPVDLTDRNWDASTYKAELIVRAEDPGTAKRLAARAYGIATKHRVGELVKIVPWDHPGFVTSTEVQPTDNYVEDGERSIVYPPKAVVSAHHGYNRE